MRMPRFLRPVEVYLRHTLLYDGYVVSYPKCGRTWLNAILLHYVRRHYDGVSEPLAFEWAPPMVKYTWYRRFPNICFTHDVSTPPKHHEEYPRYFDPSIYRDRRVILLVRDPRDVLVSHYYHAKKKTHKGTLPPDISLSDFLRHDTHGIRSLVAYFNLWAPLITERDSISQCRYEDLLTDTVGTTQRLLSFFGVPSVDTEALEWAVDQCSFKNLQKREIQVKDVDGPVDTNQLRVRRGKVGGYQDTMTDSDIQYTNAIINKHLDPLYGYSSKQDSRNASHKSEP